MLAGLARAAGADGGANLSSAVVEIDSCESMSSPQMTRRRAKEAFVKKGEAPDWVRRDDLPVLARNVRADDGEVPGEAIGGGHESESGAGEPGLWCGCVSEDGGGGGVRALVSTHKGLTGSL